MSPEPSATKERSYSGDYMAAGSKAEEIVISWLLENPHIVGVDDLRSLRPMREADCDLSVKLYDGRVQLVEIKSDRHLGKTSNVIFEINRINHTAPTDKCSTLGWSARSPAKYLIYYAPSVERIYVCQFSALRSCFQRYTRESRGSMKILVVPTDNIKTTINVLIPWEYCKDAFAVFDPTEMLIENDHRSISPW